MLLMQIRKQLLLLLLLLRLLLQLRLVSQIRPVKRRKVASRQGVNDDEHVKRKRVLGHLEHALGLRLVACRAHVSQSLEDGDEGRAEEVGEELLDDQYCVLAQGVDDFHSQLGRNGLQRTRKHGHNQQIQPQIATGIRIQIDITNRQRKRSTDEHDKYDKVILSRMIRPPAKHQTGTHDEHLERPSDNPNVYARCSVERDEIVHKGGESVDDDSGGGEGHDAMSEALASKACLKLLDELIVSNVNVQLMI
mmetsp:Transcript_34711/g.62498  ORF Transcript_34711/g.62498 Transcript_34711/m.62498 type:complete len:250 (+) Transcript_34711:205-954(+)